jgi:protocatechuate 3,4-dioxygenase beta subunit
MVGVAVAAAGAVVAVRGCDETEPSQRAAVVPAKSDVAQRRTAPRHSSSPSPISGAHAGGDGTDETKRKSAPEDDPAPSIALRVRVEDRGDGRPIADAKFEVDVIGYDAVSYATTGDDGERSVPERANVIVRVQASATGYEEAVTSVRTGAPGTAPVKVVLRLALPGRLTGVVRGPDGTAAARALVVVAPASVTLDPSSHQQRWSKLEEKSAVRVLADEQGMYSAAGLAPGVRYHAFARDSDWLTAPEARAPSVVAEDIVLPPDAPTRSQDFVLQPFGRVVVRVPAADGGSSAQVSVTVAYGNSVAVLRPDRDGTFVADRLPPGPVTATCRGEHIVERDTIVTAGETTALTLDPRTATTIRGVVVDDAGRPVPDAEVEVRRTMRAPSGWDEMTTARADASGTFTAVALKIGSCRLTATAPGFRPSAPLTVVAPADDVRIILRRAAILTFVGTTHEVTVVFDDERSETATGTGADGTVRIECEPIGDTRVRVYSAGFAPVVRRATLTAGVVAELGEISLVLPKTVHVRVADATGRPVGGAAVVHDDTDSNAWNQKSFAADADGNAVVFGGPPAGPFPLRVHAAGFLDLRTIAEVAGDAPVTVTLARGGLLWGEAVDAGGLPSPDADVHVADARSADVVTVTADRHGQFDVRVAPGRYTVRAGSGTGVSVELTEGEEEHVQLVAQTR